MARQTLECPATWKYVSKSESQLSSWLETAIKLVEAAGIEPASESSGNRASTCLAFLWISSRPYPESVDEPGPVSRLSGLPSRRPEVRISPHDALLSGVRNRQESVTVN